MDAVPNPVGLNLSACGTVVGLDSMSAAGGAPLGARRANAGCSIDGPGGRSHALSGPARARAGTWDIYVIMEQARSRADGSRYLATSGGVRLMRRRRFAPLLPLDALECERDLRRGRRKGTMVGHGDPDLGISLSTQRRVVSRPPSRAPPRGKARESILASGMVWSGQRRAPLIQTRREDPLRKKNRLRSHQRNLTRGRGLAATSQGPRWRARCGTTRRRRLAALPEVLCPPEGSDGRVWGTAAGSSA
jgi:hypothetical protein